MISCEQAPAYYKYDYAVKDDYHYVDMDKYETRDGDKTTGSYSVVLPDGRKQIVTYYVDGYSGYVADVKYEGYAKAYDYKPAAYSKPTYFKPAYETTYAAPSYKADYVPEVAYKTAEYKAEY